MTFERLALPRQILAVRSIVGAGAGCALSAFLFISSANAVIATPPSSPKTAILGGTKSSSAEVSSDANEIPPAPSVSLKSEVIGRAGIGGGYAYASAGVVELGGFANFTGASNFTSIQVSPTAGVFIFDNVELSAIIGINYVHQSIFAGGVEQSDHKTVIRILGEPSYHLPFSSTVWGFLGIGLGIASVPRAGGGKSTGFDVAPRIGANFLVGRSGLFSPAFFIDHTTGGSIPTSGGNLLGVSTTYGIQAGYTVTWW